jgi:serine/threonine protein kinase/tetratricopeptide (TPR) repeat protein
MTKHRDPWATGQLLLGDFLIQQQLGAGGMGTVYLVQSRSTGERFAVKKTHLRDAGSEAAFLTELQTWIDLPAHPHLAACRFFRTVGDEVAIFAEFVEGGSLADWIQNRRLTRLEQMLDTAIQTAWGLHAAHECSLVHQDVKPGNVLLSADGTAKVSDFGLARARAAGGELPASEIQNTVLRSVTRFVQRFTDSRRSRRDSMVSCGGMTPAYRSPEQAAGQRLSRRTDIWSWGLTVLETFTGEVTWLDGQAAADVLEMYLATGPSDPTLPEMPVGLADVLRRCFRLDPGERWQTLAEAADAVRLVYRQVLGSDHPRLAPGTTPPEPRPTPVQADAEPADARHWLTRALREQGSDAAAAEALLPHRAGSRRAQAIADIAALAEARRIYESLIVRGRSDLVSDLAFLCHFKAQLHERTRDLPGAVTLRQQAVELLDRAVNDQGHKELTAALGEAHINHGYVLWLQKDYRGALAAYDRALDLFNDLVGQAATEEEAEKTARDLASELATIHLNRAAALSGLKDHRAALALNDQAKTILAHLAREEDRPDVRDRLASAYMGEAQDLECLGNYIHAGHAYDEAIALRERLVNDQGHSEFAEALSRTYVNKAIMLRKLHEPGQAAELYDRAISLRERLVHDEGRRELLAGLARVYDYKADVLTDLREYDAARALHDQGIALWEQLVNREGERELAHALGMAYMSKGSFLSDVKDYAGAVVQFDRAIAILERLVVEEQRDEVAPDLAGTIMNKSHALQMLGDCASALALFDRVIPTWQRLIDQGHRELAPELARAYENKARVAESAEDFSAARALCDQAVELYQRLALDEGRGELNADLASALITRAGIRDRLGDRLTAVAELDLAISVLEKAITDRDSPKLHEKLKLAQSQRECLYWLHRLNADDATKPGGAVEELLTRLTARDEKPQG